MDLQNEKQRIEDLKRYAILDTSPEESFDRITRIATKVFDVPIAVISLVDDARQWFKSKQGVSVCETARDISFCTHAIEKDQPFIINDATSDPRFKDNPMVTGAPYIRFYAGIPIKSPRGYNLGTFCIIDTEPRQLSPDMLEILRDLTRVVVDEMELRSVASFDCLTGLHRRTSFMEAAKTEMQRSIRYGSNFSIITFDIDHFKKINDTYGHAAGDLVLQHISRICRDNLRVIDVAARFGGEEFVILLPETDLPEAGLIAERLRYAFENHHFIDNGNQIRFTTSFGIADRATSSAMDISTILNEADDWLYEAKANGRNQVLPKCA